MRRISLKVPTSRPMFRASVVSSLSFMSNFLCKPINTLSTVFRYRQLNTLVFGWGNEFNRVVDITTKYRGKKKNKSSARW